MYSRYRVALIQIPTAPMTAAMGGNVRVGLEDSLRDGPQQVARRTADQVRRSRTVIEALSLGEG